MVEYVTSRPLHLGLSLLRLQEELCVQTISAEKLQEMQRKKSSNDNNLKMPSQIKNENLNSTRYENFGHLDSTSVFIPILRDCFVTRFFYIKIGFDRP